jgi:hypothetical protein
MMSHLQEVRFSERIEHGLLVVLRIADEQDRGFAVIAMTWMSRFASLAATRRGGLTAGAMRCSMPNATGQIQWD